MTQGAPIFGFNANRPALVAQTTERVAQTIADALHVLNDAAYHETRRLDGSKRPADQARLEQWRQLARRLSRMSEQEQRSKLSQIAQDYARDVAGNFDPRVYKISTRFIPGLVTGLLAPRRLATLAQRPAELFSLDALADQLIIEGPTDTLRSLQQKGTLVYVPTHSSNMDSIVFGTALERVGLSPATYGAGKNLFTNPILSFFMHNLGAYRVDRRLRHKLYKDVLKAYSCVLIENGYHSLFFPGGTRSRSGAVERKLKLGLLGTGVEAFTSSLRAGHPQRVFFVPATINYRITLEAETLIGDFLSEAGKARYIIEDDESSRIGPTTSFIRKLLGMNGSVVIRFGTPMDPFGNGVDAEGISHDRRGRAVDAASYVTDVHGEITNDPARDAQYTRELGEQIAVAYQRDTVAMSTHIVAAACFAQLRQRSPSDDLFTTLRIRDVVVPRDELNQDVMAIKDQLLDLEGRGDIVLAEQLRGCSGGDIVAQALRAFEGYHRTPVIGPRDRGIELCSADLIFYYQNRLAAHGIGWDPARRDGRASTSRRAR
ncbi:MAG: 1-acyl-sn-glycerol-3-phosphate acyltransferase [Deltaproteobacteria bacterium]|jgi:glycerol-3-phosphate O-acyltransferase|nr:1-acyl-sn-glycerol-3-phosphate acyltransferase [Deltaproteobacteria bacterium]MBW2532545.1 1-acyl-sn-glycerol-3-phosphate acyltransferase [Deltaproteobacteria bacterium]